MLETFAWLDGHFDLAGRAIRTKVPIGIRPELAVDARLERAAGTGASLTKIQAAFEVASSTVAADDAEWGDSDETFAYPIPRTEVRLGIAPAGTPQDQVSFPTIASLGGDGGFSGGLSRVGLPPGLYDVWARACFGGNCGTTKTTISL